MDEKLRLKELPGPDFDPELQRFKKKHLSVSNYVRASVIVGLLMICFVAVGNFHSMCGLFDLHSRHVPSVEYLSILDSSNLAEKWLKHFTAQPHLAGSNYALVEWQAQKYREFGLQNVQIESFDIYLNYPVDTSLKLYNGSSLVFKPTLKEDVLEEDPTTSGNDTVPAFHGYSASGNVTAEYVYANYGTKEDFAFLKEQGVDVTGKIAIVRYGALFRGLKVKFAQEAGAVGVLIYSEPADDGKITEENGYKAYPEGPARNPSSIQRGSVQFLSMIPGDPTTPGWPSVGDDVARVDPHNLIPKIPSLPISYKEVLPILKALNGHGKRFELWAGGLEGVSYNVGPSPGLKLELYNEQDYKIRKIYNVYGEIPGDLKDEVVLLGNHRDAWIKGGAGDPNSGSATTLEIIRALNELREKYGWKPKRTIKFASWDGEEYALLGLTEYGELHHKELQKNVVAYLNLDDAVAGKVLELEGLPLLNRIVNRCAKMVSYPTNASLTLFDHFYLSKDKKIGMLGLGSDFTVFMEHLGISSLNAVFAPGPEDPIYHYHSNYDSFHWMQKFGDPGFKFHNTMAKFFGLIALTIADEKTLDYGVMENTIEFAFHFNETISKIPESWYTLKSHGKRSRKHCKGMSNSIDVEEVELFSVLADADMKTKIDTKVKAHSLEHFIKKVQKSIDKLFEASINFEATMQKTRLEYQYYVENYLPYNPIAVYHKMILSKKIDRINRVSMYLERLFLHYGGLTGRKWFRHSVYAVDRNNGYSAVAFPGLLEGIQDGSEQEVFKWLGIIRGIVKRVLANLNTFA